MRVNMTEVITHDEDLVASIGGKDVLRLIVEQFYGRLASDEACHMILSNFDLKALSASSLERITQALGHSASAPSQDTAPMVPAAPNKVLDRVSKHFEGALADSGVPENLRLDLTQAIQPLKTLVQRGRPAPTPPTAVPRPMRSASTALSEPVATVPTLAPGTIAVLETQYKEMQECSAVIGRTFAVIELSLDGSVTTINNRFSTITGYTPSELKGRGHKELWHPERQAAPSYKQFWDALKRGEEQTGQFQFRSKEGRDIWLAGTYAPVAGPFGTPTKIVGYLFDCTNTNERWQRAESTVSQMGKRMHDVHTTAQTMRKQTDEISSQADDTQNHAQRLAKVAYDVEAHIGAVATGTEEMGTSIREIAANAAEAAEVATKAVSITTEAHEVVGKLGASSTAIGKFVKVIKAIAEQTNLLALNATIEAARAGDAGRGFAVVAKEVKDLAKETARATEEISQRINEIQSDTSATTAAIAEIGAVIKTVNSISATIASSVEEQTTTTNEIVRTVTIVAQAGKEISGGVAHVVASAEKTVRGAQSIRQAVDDIHGAAQEWQRSTE